MKVAITGSSGYVGGRMKSYFQERGWTVEDWNRKSQERTFVLGDTVDPAALEGVQALVHCSYDFSKLDWPAIRETNVDGTKKLLDAAQKAGVRRLVVLSSASAYEGCRSLYGRAKLEIEQLALEAGALTIRPGLIYGDRPGGVFGGLVDQVRRSRFIPTLGNGKQIQRLLHEDDLARFIHRYLDGGFGAPDEPVFLAHDQAWEMRALLAEIANALDRTPTYVPVPWQILWGGLRTLETLHLPAPFRSDSLLGLVHYNRSPSFALAETLDAQCRPFSIRQEMVGS